MDGAFNRRDRTFGFVLLALAIIVAFVARFDLTGQPVNLSGMTLPWLFAAILLLTMPYAGRPMPGLIRWSAAILFILGLASPFIDHLIEQSSGV